MGSTLVNTPGFDGKLYVQTAIEGSNLINIDNTQF